MRKSKIERNTFETKIKVELNIDGTGKYENNTGVGFLDHMLDLFAKHGRFDLKVYCDGDTQVDDHHSTEDIVYAESLGVDALLIGEALMKGEIF